MFASQDHVNALPLADTLGHIITNHVSRTVSPTYELWIGFDDNISKIKTHASENWESKKAKSLKSESKGELRLSTVPEWPWTAEAHPELLKLDLGQMSLRQPELVVAHLATLAVSRIAHHKPEWCGLGSCDYYFRVDMSEGDDIVCTATATVMSSCKKTVRIRKSKSDFIEATERKPRQTLKSIEQRRLPAIPHQYGSLKIAFIHQIRCSPTEIRESMVKFLTQPLVQLKRDVGKCGIAYWQYNTTYDIHKIGMTSQRRLRRQVNGETQRYVQCIRDISDNGAKRRARELDRCRKGCDRCVYRTISSSYPALTCAIYHLEKLLQLLLGNECLSMTFWPSNGSKEHNHEEHLKMHGDIEQRMLTFLMDSALDLILHVYGQDNMAKFLTAESDGKLIQIQPTAAFQRLADELRHPSVTGDFEHPFDIIRSISFKAGVPGCTDGKPLLSGTHRNIGKVDKILDEHIDKREDTIDERIKLLEALVERFKSD